MGVFFENLSDLRPKRAILTLMRPIDLHVAGIVSRLPNEIFASFKAASAQLDLSPGEAGMQLMMGAVSYCRLAPLKLATAEAIVACEEHCALGSVFDERIRAAQDFSAEACKGQWGPAEVESWWRTASRLLDVSLAMAAATERMTGIMARKDCRVQAAPSCPLYGFKPVVVRGKLLPNRKRTWQRFTTLQQTRIEFLANYLGVSQPVLLGQLVRIYLGQPITQFPYNSYQARCLDVFALELGRDVARTEDLRELIHESPTDVGAVVPQPLIRVAQDRFAQIIDRWEMAVFRGVLLVAKERGREHLITANGGANDR